MPRRTKAEAAQTREAVLTAAIEVFLDRGVTRATFDEIARAAGVTRGAIYWHFKDKLEIFQVLERRANLPNEEIGNRLKDRLAENPGLNPIDELAATIREGLQSFEANPERNRIMTILWQRCEYVGEMSPALERQQRADAALQALFEAVLASAAKRGLVAPGWPPKLAAYALLLLMNGAVSDWLRNPKGARLVTSAMPLAQAFLDSIRAPAASDAKPPKASRGKAAAKSRAAPRQ